MYYVLCIIIVITVDILSGIVTVSGKICRGGRSVTPVLSSVPGHKNSLGKRLHKRYTRTLGDT